mmetsp:Transcript_48288/g.116107  ORF Transcript_48288/g.116107 Transcript_48288/m.116107 type:complete len:227 (+) Transcript_48288:499-1179(+)
MQRRGDEQALEQCEQPRRGKPLRLTRGEQPPPQREQGRLQQRAHRRARRRTRQSGGRLCDGGGVAVVIVVSRRSGGDGRFGGRGGAHVLEQRQHVRAREVGRGEFPQRHARAWGATVGSVLPACGGGGGEVGARRGQQQRVRGGGGEADLQRGRAQHEAEREAEAEQRACTVADGPRVRLHQRCHLLLALPPPLGRLRRQLRLLRRAHALGDLILESHVLLHARQV